MDKKKILIIDDEEGLRNAIRRLLLLEKNYEIDEAADGYIGEQKIESFNPDLVILDLKMPGKDGYEVCEGIRNNPETANLKIIAYSGLLGEDEKQRMQALGVSHFFEKPFDIDKFKMKIYEVLND